MRRRSGVRQCDDRGFESCGGGMGGALGEEECEGGGGGGDAAGFEEGAEFFEDGGNAFAGGVFGNIERRADVGE